MKLQRTVFGVSAAAALAAASSLVAPKLAAQSPSKGRDVAKIYAESCANCHGEVGGMAQVSQVSTLKMGWCIQCHMERGVSRDCSVCHY